ncbi:MAG: hypothetical protein JW732_07925 [Dehalococcoidia bacterium]|nr:hypothetical protein [Dehalococcoidia bacterium]
MERKGTLSNSADAAPKADRVIKIIAAICFVLIGVALYAIRNSPAIGYELSIYKATPPLALACLLSCIASGIGIIVYQVSKVRNWWQTGLALILLSNLIIVLLPFLRGYAFSAVDDHLGHLGAVKDILQTGGIPSSNFYPPTHILISQLCSITNVSPEAMINFAGPFFYILFVSFTYLLSREILFRSAAILATAAGTVLICYYYAQIFPMGFTFMIFPLVFYLYFKYQKQGTASVGIPLILLIALTVLFHMVAGFMLTVALLVIELGKPIFNKLYSRKKELPHSFSSRVKSISLSFFLVSFIILLLWVWRYYGIWESRVLQVVRWFHLELLVKPMTTQAAEAFTTLGLSLSDQLELFVKMYGHFAIYAVLCIIPLIVIVRRRDFPGNTDMKSVFLFSCVFVVTAAMAIIDIVRPMTGLNAGRIIWAVTALFPPLVGLALYKIGGIEPHNNKELIKKPTSHNIKPGRAIAVGLIITVCSLIGIFSIYPSPFILQPNLGATHMDTSGEYWLLEQGNPELRVIGVGYVTPDRFARALWGTPIQNYPRWDSFAPKNFNYTEYQALGESLDRDKYMSIDKAGELAYLELYPQIDKFTTSDFAKLQRDSTIDKLYANGEMRIWYVHSQSTEK